MSAVSAQGASQILEDGEVDAVGRRFVARRSAGVRRRSAGSARRRGGGASVRKSRRGPFFPCEAVLLLPHKSKVDFVECDTNVTYVGPILLASGFWRIWRFLWVAEALLLMFQSCGKSAMIRFFERLQLWGFPSFNPFLTCLLSSSYHHLPPPLILLLILLFSYSLSPSSLFTLFLSPCLSPCLSLSLSFSFPVSSLLFLSSFSSPFTSLLLPLLPLSLLLPEARREAEARRRRMEEERKQEARRAPSRAPPKGQTGERREETREMGREEGRGLRELGRGRYGRETEGDEEREPCCV